MGRRWTSVVVALATVAALAVAAPAPPVGADQPESVTSIDPAVQVAVPSGLFQLSARIQRVDAGPVGFVQVEMRDATGQLLCIARNQRFVGGEYVGCSVLLDPVGVIRTTLGLGYDAVFPGDPFLAPASAHGALLG